MTELSLALAGLINLIVAVLPWILGVVLVIIALAVAFWAIVAGSIFRAHNEIRRRQPTNLGGF